MHEPLATLPLEMKADAVETRGVDWGGTTVRAITLPPGTDFRPLLAGLPGDVCACPHWGYVLQGSITIRYADGSEEVTGEGEAYYWPGGHTGWVGADGISFVEFRPTDEITPVLQHLAAKMSS
jgi:hypothetical protein